MPTPRYQLRMGRDQQERYRELLQRTEPLDAEIALNQWALEHHVRQWSEQRDPNDSSAMAALSTMIAGHTEAIRKLEETRHRIEHDQRLSWTPRQVQNFIMAVAGIIDRFVADAGQRRQIAAQLKGLLQNKRYVQWPDEDTAGELLTRFYSDVLITDG